MKLFTRTPLLLAVVTLASLAAPARSRADLDASTIEIDKIPMVSGAPDQLLSVEFGNFEPRSIQINNGSYQFDYGHNLSTYEGKIGWAGRVAHLLGSEYFEMGVVISTLSGSVAQATGDPLPPISGGSYTLFLLGFEPRLMYAADWFPVKWIVPFGDVGYRYTTYYQSASAGVESMEGGAGNFAWGAGLRLWLNRSSSMRTGATPFFVSFRYDQLLPSAAALNLASSSVLGGLSLGF